MRKEKETRETQKKREKFLAAYRELGIIRDAAKVANIARATVYRWLDDETFRAQFEEAKEEAIEKLEREAVRRACEGVDKPIYYKGQLVDTVREYSDTLLIFLLKGLRPDKYAERVKQDVNATFTIEDALAEIDS
jgi:hypothetical protein